MEIPIENVEAIGDRTREVDGVPSVEAVSAEVNLRRISREDKFADKNKELIGELNIEQVDEGSIDFGEELSLVDQVSSRLSIARNSDEEPALAMRSVLRDFKDQLGSVGVRHITEQIVARSGAGDPELRAGIQAEQEQGYWKVPENADEVLEEDRQAIVKAANLGDREEMERLRAKMPISYELVVDAIFNKALEQAGSANLVGALNYLNNIPGMRVKPVLTLGKSPTLIRSFE